MRVAVLLPGPSLAKLSELPPADVHIAVKRAGLRWPAAWSVILDSPCLRSYGDQLLGRPKMLTRAAYRPKYTLIAGLDVEALAAECPAPCDRWTSAAALALAAWLHASEVRAYGADFNGGAQFDGFSPPDADLSAGRFERELADWDAVAAWLAARGTGVVRVG